MTVSISPVFSIKSFVFVFLLAFLHIQLDSITFMKRFFFMQSRWIRNTCTISTKNICAAVLEIKKKGLIIFFLFKPNNYNVDCLLSDIFNVIPGICLHNYDSIYLF